MQRCGYESVPEWFFWFLVGSRSTGGLTGTGTGLGRGFFQDFLQWRVSWPVVGVRMRLARLERPPRDVEGLDSEGRGRGTPKGYEGPGKEGYRGITRLLRSADSPEEIIAATHVSDYGYRARLSCALGIDSQIYKRGRDRGGRPRKHGKRGLIADPNGSLTRPKACSFSRFYTHVYIHIYIFFYSVSRTQLARRVVFDWRN